MPNIFDFVRIYLGSTEPLANTTITGFDGLIFCVCLLFVGDGLWASTDMSSV